MGRKTCLNCMNGVIVHHNNSPWDQVSKPYEIDCTLREEIIKSGKVHKWNETYMPEVCGSYRPKMVEKCAYCKKTIDAAEYLWDKWGGINGRPVCSNDCAVKLEAAEVGSMFYD
ncbi:hypothetical protein [Dehalobacterium formicoaceticum]|uniref:hypothetical protein n=1 Tax=Dehalobacterium formicoaceticum TaxID=51515 RepID=UPI0012F70B08|nr:hypothetical protein [Dehalobacterium formicoaceticum]